MFVNPFENIILPEYTYNLPESRIASFPAPNRDESLLLIHNSDGSLSHDRFRNIAGYLEESCQLVINNSKVIPARLNFVKSSGAKIELFCLAPLNPSVYDQALSSTSSCEWECMAGNLKRFNSGPLLMHLTIGRRNIQLHAEKIKQIDNLVHIRFSWQDHSVSFAEILSAVGKTPLPPYIKREPVETDRERYQTIYSKHQGSVAAPTAGLHFTAEVLEQLRHKGISIHEVTLHVGAGTFQPIKSDSLINHRMHAEFIHVSRDFIASMADLKNPVVAVGTTSVRTLESLYWVGVKILKHDKLTAHDLCLDQWEAYALPQETGMKEAFQALEQWLVLNRMPDLFTSTRLMIVPGYRFRVINTLVTNFHQPGSTLLLLVGAFLGQSWKSVYQYALENGFRFLSYGDSSLLFRK
jgi:S-adenosylmethionine:tRNA ribosyltransferase-isomerase